MQALAIEPIDIKILLSNDGDADLEQPRDDPAPRGQNEKGKWPEPSAGTTSGGRPLQSWLAQFRALTRHGVDSLGELDSRAEFVSCQRLVRTVKERRQATTGRRVVARLDAGL